MVLFSSTILTKGWKSYELKDKERITIERSINHDIHLAHVSVSLVRAILKKG